MPNVMKRIEDLERDYNNLLETMAEMETRIIALENRGVTVRQSQLSQKELEPFAELIESELKYGSPVEVVRAKIKDALDDGRVPSGGLVSAFIASNRLSGKYFIDGVRVTAAERRKLEKDSAELLNFEGAAG